MGRDRVSVHIGPILPNGFDEVCNLIKDLQCISCIVNKEIEMALYCKLRLIKCTWLLIAY